MKICSLGRTVTSRFFGIFNYAMFGNERRVYPDKGNYTELQPCFEAYLKYIKRNKVSL